MYYNILQYLVSDRHFADFIVYLILYICIPTYILGAELWGIEKYPDLERVQYYACKRFMCAKRGKSSCRRHKQKAPNFAVIGDCSLLGTQCI